MDGIKYYWKSFFFEGIVFVLLGLFAISMPWFFTFSFEFALGIVLAVAGFVQGYRSLTSRDTDIFFPSFLSAIFLLVAGLLMLFYPLTGALTLTALIGVYFLVDGCVRMITAVQMQDYEGWVRYLFGGFFEVLLALIVWNQWPISGVWFIGLLVGVHLFYYGFLQISLALAARKLASH